MFADRLKHARLSKGLSQKDVAAELHISQQAYAKYETGASSPNPEVLGMIANIYGVTADYLLGLSDKKEAHPIEQGQADARSEDEERQVKEFLSLPPVKRKLVLELMRETIRQQNAKSDQ